MLPQDQPRRSDAEVAARSWQHVSPGAVCGVDEWTPRQGGHCRRPLPCLGAPTRQPYRQTAARAGGASRHEQTRRAANRDWRQTSMHPNYGRNPISVLASPDQKPTQPSSFAAQPDRFAHSTLHASSTSAGLCPPVPLGANHPHRRHPMGIARPRQHCAAPKATHRPRRRRTAPCACRLVPSSPWPHTPPRPRQAAAARQPQQVPRHQRLHRCRRGIDDPDDDPRSAGKGRGRPICGS